MRSSIVVVMGSRLSTEASRNKLTGALSELKSDNVMPRSLREVDDVGLVASLVDVSTILQIGSLSTLAHLRILPSGNDTWTTSSFSDKMSSSE